MNVIIGWILLVIAMSIFITFAFRYDMDIKDKIVCVVGAATCAILIIVSVYLIAG